jgi:hypothetical protein
MAVRQLQAGVAAAEAQRQVTKLEDGAAKGGDAGERPLIGECFVDKMLSQEWGGFCCACARVCRGEWWLRRQPGLLLLSPRVQLDVCAPTVLDFLRAIVMFVMLHSAGPEDAAAIPTVMAPRRSATIFNKNTGSRKASLHVDNYEGRKGPAAVPAGSSSAAAPPAAAALAAALAAGGVRSGAAAADVPAMHRGIAAAAAAAGMGAAAMQMPGAASGVRPPRHAPIPIPPGAAAGAQQQQRQRQREQAPRQQQQQQVNDPRQLWRQQQQRQGTPQQQQQQQVKVEPGSPGGGGSDLLGGLEGNSPSYHASPDADSPVGGGGDEEVDLQRQSAEAGADDGMYMVSEQV